MDSHQPSSRWLIIAFAGYVVLLAAVGGSSLWQPHATMQGRAAQRAEDRRLTQASMQLYNLVANAKTRADVEQLVPDPKPIEERTITFANGAPSEVTAVYRDPTTGGEVSVHYKGDGTCGQKGPRVRPSPAPYSPPLAGAISDLRLHVRAFEPWLWVGSLIAMPFIPSCFRRPLLVVMLAMVLTYGVMIATHPIWIRRFSTLMYFAGAQLVISLWMGWYAFAWRRPRKLRDPSLCATCGYDLRATPDRCPECGTVPLGTRRFTTWA